MLTDEPVIPILLATDLPASRRFSEEVLGLAAHRASDSTVTDARGGRPRLRPSKWEDGTKDSQTQPTRIVPDARSTVAELRARGAALEEYDTDELKTEDGVADQGEAFVARLTDPGKNVIGIETPEQPPRSVSVLLRPPRSSTDTDQGPGQGRSKTATRTATVTEIAPTPSATAATRAASRW